jgi:hypothetical protein
MARDCAGVEGEMSDDDDGGYCDNLRCDLTEREAAGVMLLDCPARGFDVKWLRDADMGAYQLSNGEWRYPLATIRQARVKLDRIRAANEAGVVLMPEPSDDLPPAPTFKGDQ